jgi:ribosomal protein S18 acetylase RimI-like enzyme
LKPGQLEIDYSDTMDRVDWAGLKRDLAADAFDNGRSPELLQRSFQSSFASEFALCGDRVVGTARALSDGVCNAYVVDVWTASAYRRRGIATTIMKRLLDRLTGQHVYLFTDDAIAFYRRLGFQVQGVGMSNVVGQWLQTRSPMA